MKLGPQKRGVAQLTMRQMTFEKCWECVWLMTSFQVKFKVWLEAEWIMKIAHAPPTADLRPLSPFFGPECSKLGALNRHYKHVVYSVHLFVCELGFFLLFTFFFLGGWRTLPNHLQYLDPQYVQGLGIAVTSGAGRADHTPRWVFPVFSSFPPFSHCPVSYASKYLLPLQLLVFRGVLCSGKVNFLSVKREIDMAASCFISWIETLKIVQVAVFRFSFPSRLLRFVFFFLGFLAAWVDK